MRHSGFTLAVGITVLGALGDSPAPSQTDAARPIEFNRQIRPILSEHCFKCHGFDRGSRQAGLRLDRPEGATSVLKSGTVAIVSGEPDKSELLRRVGSSDPAVRMPPPDADKALNADQIALLERWIKEGAVWKKHWSLIPPVAPDVPASRSAKVLRNPIDCFIADRLTQEGMNLSPPADRATLIRRVTLDLTGLPPTLAEVDAFLADTAEDAYENLVRRLLNSPRYGEQMARQWLDAARYADTNGRHHDDIRTLWPWRDWVINALNDNMPFDQFTVEQLAGDMLPQATVEHQVASGFNRNHTTSHEGGAIPEELRVLYVTDRVVTTSTVFMGLTMGCAQCHDHKYDPVTQKDFYRFFAFFNNVPEKGLDGRIGNSKPTLRLPTAKQEARLADLDRQIADFEQEIKARKSELAAGAASASETTDSGNANGQKQTTKDLPVPDDEQHKQLVAQRDELNEQRKAVDKTVLTTMVMHDMGKRRQTHLLIRGQYDQHGEPVSPGVPAVLGSLPEGAPADRLSFARWLVDPSHPLTARVTVNRYWQHYFGAGIVNTPEDFGTQGQWPSHPELLDYLARRFIDGGWDVKAMQYLIVNSATYRQSSWATGMQLQHDLQNRLLGRGTRHRLSAETIRNTALAVGGLLVEKIGGPSVRPYQPPGLWREVSSYPDDQNMGFQAQVFAQDHGADLYRRSMYTFWKRTSPPPNMIAFDAPNRETCIVRRARTNTPLQALVLMNDPQFIEAARAMARRMIKEGGAAQHDRIRFGFRLATARRPIAAEVDLLSRLQTLQLEEFRRVPDRALAFLAVGESPRDDTLDAGQLAAWMMVASTILNLDETISKE